jgi:hypothetical protein
MVLAALLKSIDHCHFGTTTARAPTPAHCGMYHVKCAHSYTLCDGLTYSAGICVLESVNSLVPEHFQLFLPMWCNPFLGLQFERNNGKIVKAFTARSTQMKLKIENSKLVQFRFTFDAKIFPNSA